MSNHGDGKGEPISEVVGAARFGVEFVAHGMCEPARVGGPFIEAEKRSHDLDGDICGGTVEMRALPIQHRPRCRKSLRVKVVGAQPHPFSKFAQMQGRCGFAECESVSC